MKVHDLGTLGTLDLDPWNAPQNNDEQVLERPNELAKFQAKSEL